MTFYPSFALEMIESRHQELLREAEIERSLRAARPTKPARPAYKGTARRPLGDRIRALATPATARPQPGSSGTIR